MEPAFAARVLVVDDEAEIRETVELTLAERLKHCSIETAPDAGVALAAMERRPADVVVADYRMPGMDGLELLGQLRARWPQTLRIMLTSYGDLGLAQHAVNDCHVHAFLVKPVDGDALARQVAEAVNIAAQAKLRERIGALQDQIVQDALAAARLRSAGASRRDT